MCIRDRAYDDSSDGSTGETASKYNFYVKLDDDNGLMMGPVSYTHLDVYKRQSTSGRTGILAVCSS